MKKGVGGGYDWTVDFDRFVNPSEGYRRPEDVVNDPDLSLNEKRAILAGWASDACAVEGMPAFRHGPNGRSVKFDEIMEALRSLDKEYAAVLAKRGKQPRRAVPSFIRQGGSGHSDQGAPLH